jgi:hypothetical protein
VTRLISDQRIYRESIDNQSLLPVLSDHVLKKASAGSISKQHHDFFLFLNYLVFIWPAADLTDSLISWVVSCDYSYGFLEGRKKVDLGHGAASSQKPTQFPWVFI